MATDEVEEKESVC